ncbi:MAG: DNA-directed RNA polymerase subunit beta' [Firmicutes bacterium]|nr:DNA-directed RNA polymerase subunit beta' [Bacillota bacterium]
MNVKNEQEILFDSIKISLASPEKIREWSRGEVKKPETINYRTLKPERDGLFCERIFGPSKDWECHCGKYKRIRYSGVVCDRCGVEVTKNKVRRERMGHIELAAPVSHIWYFRGIPSRMGIILGMSPKSLEKILYFASYVVLDAGSTNLDVKDVLSEQEYKDNIEKYGYDAFRVGMGAESVRELLANIDLEAESEKLKSELRTATGQKRTKHIKKLEVIESFKTANIRPEWMIMDAIPVIPPDLRPMVQLDGGRFATSDLNDLYRRVLNRNNRLKRLLDLGAPDIIVRNEKRMLQESIDALIDNGRRGRPVTGPGNRPLKSLSDMLKGKQGRFRQNLLGKRVDYSGRSVIVVGPHLKLYQCGLPREMAVELFKPFVMKRLVQLDKAHNIKSAKRMVERLLPAVWDALEDVIKEHPVMLNRAPTLHRLGIQAFEPVLVEGRALKLHPLVCAAYNADFDGDQMAVHVPLSVEAQAECRFLLLAPNNLLKPSDGAPITVPTKDMVLGIYYLTVEKDGEIGEGKVFSDVEEALLAYHHKEITLHAKIKIRRQVADDNGVVHSRLMDITLGRALLNEAIPQEIGFIDRSVFENKFLYEINTLVDNKMLGRIVSRCINALPPTQTAEMLDNIKMLGFNFATRGSLTVSVSDMKIPQTKVDILESTENTVENFERMFRRGLMTDEERHNKVIDAWNEANRQITVDLMDNLGKDNNIFMMMDSGARASRDQLKQLAGMRGLTVNPSGKVLEVPIKSNYREGLTVLEYFVSGHSARKGLTDTALRTADSGYLTRRLVDVSQDIIIRELDCHPQDDGKVPGMWVSAFMDGPETIEPLSDRIRGRWSILDIVHPETGEILVHADTLVSPDQAEIVAKSGIDKVLIRTILTCRSRVGLCSKCYGANMASGREVGIGESVGIIAAQSIGEPGTQLTMRTFHLGGIASNEDITQGLPRVEELFEARKPKGLAIIAESGGRVAIGETKKKREVTIFDDQTNEQKDYLIPYGSRIKVQHGDIIEKGDELTEGSVYPHDMLRIKGLRGVQDYLLREVQRVYRLQGVDINDKHIEVIVRQMLKRIKIEEPGNTDFLPGSLIDWLEFEEINERMQEENVTREQNGEEPLELATGNRMLLGITKASLATDSFLSAASFQETTRVLTEASISGKTDPLIGLKENVIIGKLIPAGTGMLTYRNIEVASAVPEEEEEEPQIGQMGQPWQLGQSGQFLKAWQNRPKFGNSEIDDDDDDLDELDEMDEKDLAEEDLEDLDELVGIKKTEETDDFEEETEEDESDEDLEKEFERELVEVAT